MKRFELWHCRPALDRKSGLRDPRPARARRWQARDREMRTRATARRHVGRVRLTTAALTTVRVRVDEPPRGRRGRSGRNT